MKKVEIIKAVKENNLFELVAQRGHEMERRDLLTIIKELEYVVYDNVDVLVKKEINEDLVDALAELWEENVLEEAEEE